MVSNYGNSYCPLSAATLNPTGCMHMYDLTDTKMTLSHVTLVFAQLTGFPFGAALV